MTSATMTSNVFPMFGRKGDQAKVTHGEFPGFKLEKFRTESFLRDASQAAEYHGCKFLFDFPASLIGNCEGKAAAIVCPDEQGLRIVFLYVDDETGEICLVEADQAPQRLVNFASSYATILASLPTAEAGQLQ